MARSSACLALCALAAAFVLLPQAARAVAPDELTFPQLRDKWNTTRQWRLSMATSHSGSAFVPVNCSKPTLGACTSTNPPLEQGESNDRLMVNWTMFQARHANGTVATYKGMQPTKVQIRACYSLNTSVDRAWRRKNKPYPRLSQNCPRKIVTVPFNGSFTTPDFAANSGSYIWELNGEDEIPVSTWFLMMWVYCGDDQVCAFESTEGRNDVSPPVAGNFFETNVQMGITPGMRAAAIILSIFAPVFFFVFLGADHFYYKKYGKPIVLF